MAMTDAEKMISQGMSPELAKVVQGAISTASGSVTSAEITDATTIGRNLLTASDQNAVQTIVGPPAWADVTGKPSTFPPVIGTTSTTALAGNTAIPAAASTAPAALAAAAAVGVGTTWARADHVHAIPGASAGSVRGTVLIQAAEADLAGGADLPTAVTKINAILAKLRTAGVLSS